MKNISVTHLAKLKARGEKIVMLTCYDAGFTPLLEEAGVEVILVGDSLGMVVQGHDTTVSVSLEDMLYHTRLVSGASRQALLVADMPFLSYCSPQQALATAARLVKEGGAQMVKLEGGTHQLGIVEALSSQGVSVCAHLGLQPQSIHRLGGYRVQGKAPEAADLMLQEAKALEQAGAQLLVLECVPALLAGQISASLSIPVIGIGAGVDCDGQVLVLHDVLGISRHRPRFARDFLAQEGSIAQAIERYVSAVKSAHFPSAEEVLA
jgi:3-methyl-2-oxobutanoate hydroxymethyltransferase